jgi:hypothetical protein
MTPEELAEMLFKSLLSADAALMNAVARNAVDRYAGMEPGGRSGARTTSTGRCGTSTSTGAGQADGQAQAGAAGGD